MSVSHIRSTTFVHYSLLFVCIAIMNTPLLCSMYHAVFSQGNKLSGLLPGKKIYHRNQNGYLQLHAKWDPTSDDCFIVGSLDFPRQVSPLVPSLSHSPANSLTLKKAPDFLHDFCLCVVWGRN